ncbi:TetR/AcrR family transcriptional regulator [Streptomyces sp. NPDC059218]|uniref:TetR/AcrR family transcriptional regulator n=1 Tax=unclassified Streptomyces TaxID=2593676 RepID=UPI0036B9BECA
MNGESKVSETGRTRRRRRSRQETEADLLDAARRLLQRDGVLAGVNLREIATEAGVNHGQIYQYFGTRQALLRASVADLVEHQSADREGHWELPFTERRAAMFRHRLTEPELVKLEALLALDGDEDFSALPRFAQTRRSLARDQEQGALPADADTVAAHVMTAAAQMGYVIFREVYARDTGIPLAELDERAERMYARMVAGIAGGAGQAPDPDRTAGIAGQAPDPDRNAGTAGQAPDPDRNAGGADDNDAPL